MTFVLKHTLRASVDGVGTPASAWTPRLGMTLTGPTPAGAELVWAVAAREYGDAYSRRFEHRTPVPEQVIGQTVELDLRPPTAYDDTAETAFTHTGAVDFTVRLVSELDGVDQLLHEGRMTVVAVSAGARGACFVVDNDWMLTRAYLVLDTEDDPEAPRLRVTAFLAGDADAYQLEAHLFYNGVRLARASGLDDRDRSVASDGSVTVTEVVAEFDDVRGWNNLSDTGWGAGWHLLDAHDGAYEVKVVWQSQIVRTISFEVDGGRITAAGSAWFDPWGRTVMVVRAESGEEPAETQNPDATPAFYGDAVSAARLGSVDDVYALRRVSPAEEAPPFDDDTAAALHAFVDRAERLIITWETDMIGGAPPFDFGEVLAAEAVAAERPGYDALADATAAVPADYEIVHDGSPISVGRLRQRVDAIFAAAGARITGSTDAVEAELAPFRTVLRGDKLSVFEDHPANEFVYQSTSGTVIQTPRELAEAEFWYFEGPIDLPVTARVDGVEVKGNVRGWRVRGWQFDSDGSIVDTFETQGQGSNAPPSAFQRV